MAFSQGSRSRLSFIEETTFGTTPSGDFNNIPFNTHSLNLTKERVSGNEIQPDRMLRVDRHGNRQVGGDIAVDLRATDFDAFLESVMLSTWVTSSGTPDELKVGTTPKYFSIEDFAADIDQARLFTGCTMSSMNISIAPNQMVTSTFGVVGKDMTISQTEKTVASSTVNNPFDSYSGDVQIADTGGSLSAITSITAVDFTLDNSFSPTFVVGDDSAPHILSEMASIEGTFSAYFEDASLIERFINETETQLSVSVNDPSGVNEYEFLFPRIKINGADVPVGGTGPRIVELPFVALYDDTNNSNLVIYRPDST